MIYFGWKQTNLVENSVIHLEKEILEFKSQILEKIKCAGTELRRIQCAVALFYVLPGMFTYKLEFRIARAWLNGIYVKVLLYFPPGTEVAGDNKANIRFSSEISSGRSTRKIINNTLYIMHSVSQCTLAVRLYATPEVLLSK